MVISHHRATNMPSLASINPLSCGSFFRGRGKTSSLSFPFIFAEQSYPRSLGGGRPCSRKVNLPCGTKAERDLHRCHAPPSLLRPIFIAFLIPLPPFASIKNLPASFPLPFSALANEAGYWQKEGLESFISRDRGECSL